MSARRPGDLNTAAGDEAPAFTTTLALPSSAATISPVIRSFNERLTYTRGTPFVVRRSSGTIGTFHINLGQPHSVSRGNTVSVSFDGSVGVHCVFPAATEVATVPAAALRDFVPSNATSGPQTTVSVHTETTAEVVAGDYEVEVEARDYSSPGLLDVL